MTRTVPSATPPSCIALAKDGAAVRRRIDQADKLGRQDTAGIFPEISRGTDKYPRFIEAHLN